MFRFAPWIASVLLAFTTPASAQQDAVLVELFTSQGCSSCPPADAFLHELAKRDDVVALALHVDYWDYIGWKDIFAKPQFTERQYAYAREGRRRMVYTPQMVINGSEHVVGNQSKDANHLIDLHKARSKTVDISGDLDGQTLTLSGKALGGAQGETTIRLMRYRPSSTVKITRGENAGRTIDYANVVTHMEIVGTWDTKEALDMTLSLEGDLPAVIVVQQGVNGTVTAALKVK